MSPESSTLERAVAEVRPRRIVLPTLWGLTPTQLHDRFWAARGVQVVRQGQAAEIVERAELFLLLGPRTLAIFKLYRVLDMLCWDGVRLLGIRLHDERDHGYRERVITAGQERFVRFQRIYDASDFRLARAAVARDASLARLWQDAPDAREGWKRLRTVLPASHRGAISAAASVYDRGDDRDMMDLTCRLAAVWQRPDMTVRKVVKVSSGVWADPSAEVDRGVRFIGPAWIGAGRRLDSQECVIGPAILWDDPDVQTTVDDLRWDEIEPTKPVASVPVVGPVRLRTSALWWVSKRAFDVVVALVALAATLPMYPLIMLAIWLEDGRPFFFAHRRETRGGKEFACVKFRSMAKNAEVIKRQLASRNRADGPQFYIENDPRLTRVGRFLRRCNLDELPQFLNVLLGQMSVVGPRPSPRVENQFCPGWREARLSVRPGITGLWQVKRTRQTGLDFQEWIKYDIRYVENASWGLDLTIIALTVGTILRGVFGHER